jgi:hypothetical protein
MIKYIPVKIKYYFLTHWWIWAATAAALTTWIGIDFTDQMDWGTGEESNGHWSWLPIVLLIWWIANAIGIFCSLIRDTEENAIYFYRQEKQLHANREDGRVKIEAKAEGDEVNIYQITKNIKGKEERLLARFNLNEDLEATDRAIEFVAHQRAHLKEQKRQKEQAKKYSNREAESVARVINRG